MGPQPWRARKITSSIESASSPTPVSRRSYSPFRDAEALQRVEKEIVVGFGQVLPLGYPQL
jgi:hypothetical protein